MKLGELIAIVRNEIDDATAPYLWSDPEMIDYAIDAENEACRRSRLLIDSTTTAICQIAVVAGTSVYALDPRVLFVRRVKLAAQDQILGRVAVRDMDYNLSGWESDTGTPSHFITDYQTGKIRLYPIPVVNGTLNLTVVRMPLVDCDEITDTPEIHVRMHRSLRFWMMYRAYSKQDSETKDDRKAAESLAFFEEEFGRKSSVIDEEWIAREQMGDVYDGTY